MPFVNYSTVTALFGLIAHSDASGAGARTPPSVVSLWSQVRRLVPAVAVPLFASHVAEAMPLTVACKVSARSQAGFEAVLNGSLRMFMKQNFPGTSVSKVKFELVPVAGRAGQRAAADLAPLWGVGPNGALLFKALNLDSCTLDFVANIRSHVNGAVFRVLSDRSRYRAPTKS